MGPVRTWSGVSAGEVVGEVVEVGEVVGEVPDAGVVTSQKNVSFNTLASSKVYTRDPVSQIECQARFERTFAQLL